MENSTTSQLVLLTLPGSSVHRIFESYFCLTGFLVFSLHRIRVDSLILQGSFGI